jgi:hypothetical protein
MTPKDLKEIKECIDERFTLHEKIITVRFDRLEEITSEHHTTLYGNGSEGLKTKVERIETAHSTLHRVWIFVTAGVVTLATWIGVNK